MESNVGDGRSTHSYATPEPHLQSQQPKEPRDSWMIGRTEYNVAFI